jgi:glycosyltransferase involved in cell wall biosynthesis
LAGLSRPILGYFGEMAHWFDAQAVRSLAASRPVWSLVLIGPLHTAAAGSLLELPNVHYLGRRPYQELPRYLAHFDVCLLPFRVSELTSATNPIKLYEYALPSSRLSKYQSLPRLVPFTCPVVARGGVGARAVVRLSASAEPRRPVSSSEPRGASSG